MIGRLRKLLVGQQPGQNALPSPIISDEITPEEVLHDAAARFLDAQISTLDVLDNRTVGIFTVASTILLLTFGLFDLRTAVISERATWLLRGAHASYVVLLLFAWRGSRIRALEFRPNLATLLEHSQTLEGNLLRRGWQSNISSQRKSTTRTCKKRPGGLELHRAFCSSKGFCFRQRLFLCFSCDLTSRGGGSGFSVLTRMFDGPGGGNCCGFGTDDDGLGVVAVAIPDPPYPLCQLYQQRQHQRPGGCEAFTQFIDRRCFIGSWPRAWAKPSG